MKLETPEHEISRVPVDDQYRHTRLPQALLPYQTFLTKAKAIDQCSHGRAPAMLAIGRETEGNGRASRLLGLDATHRHGRGAVFSAGSAQWTLPCPWLQSDRGLVRNGAPRMVGSVHSWRMRRCLEQ